MNAKDWKQGDEAWTAWALNGELNTSRFTFAGRNTWTNRLVFNLPAGRGGTTEIIDELVSDTESGAIENLIVRSREEIEQLVKQKKEIDELISMYEKDIKVASKAMESIS